MHLIALLLLGSILGAVEYKERPDIDPIYQGVWKAIVVSKDKGKTTQAADVVVARARAASIILPNGEILKVDRVVDVAADAKTGRDAANSIFFEGTRMSYAVSNKGDNMLLLQVFRPKNEKVEELEETLRYVIRIVE